LAGTYPGMQSAERRSTYNSSGTCLQWCKQVLQPQPPSPADARAPPAHAVCMCHQRTLSPVTNKRPGDSRAPVIYSTCPVKMQSTQSQHMFTVVQACSPADAVAPPAHAVCMCHQHTPTALNNNRPADGQAPVSHSSRQVKMHSTQFQHMFTVVQAGSPAYAGAPPAHAVRMRHQLGQAASSAAGRAHQQHRTRRH
jgi:hypothetical protein